MGKDPWLHKTQMRNPDGSTDKGNHVDARGKPVERGQGVSCIAASMVHQVTLHTHLLLCIESVCRVCYGKVVQRKEYSRESLEH